MEWGSCNKDHFQCLKLDDDSVYYGEVAMFDEEDKLVSQGYIDGYERELKQLLSKGQQAKKRLFKAKRHGMGTQIFSRPDGSVLSKYEGTWRNGKMDGKGRMIYPDSSEYYGELKEAKKHGFGTFTWPDGCKYEGSWVSDLMEGPGDFTHPEGALYSGMFKGGYYHQGGGIAIDPFKSAAEIESLVSGWGENQKKMTARAVEGSRLTQVAKGPAELVHWLQSSIDGQKIVPLVVGEKE